MAMILLLTTRQQLQVIGRKNCVPCFTKRALFVNRCGVSGVPFAISMNALTVEKSTHAPAAILKLSHAAAATEVITLAIAYFSVGTGEDERRGWGPSIRKVSPLLLSGSYSQFCL